MGGFNVVHDLLDKQLVDRRGQRIGRVDEIVVELRDGAPPRIAELLVGAPARAARVGRWREALGRLMRRALGRQPAALARIAVADVRVIAKHVEVDVVGIDSPAMRAERRLRALLRHIPGAERKREEPL